MRNIVFFNIASDVFMASEQLQEAFLDYWRNHPRIRLADLAAHFKISRDEANTLKINARKSLSPQERNDLIPWATLEEQRTAISRLPPESHTELYQYAQKRFGWVEKLIQNDLYPMAILRHLEGSRRWDLDRDLVGTLHGSIKSIASDEVKKIAKALGAKRGKKRGTVKNEG